MLSVYKNSAVSSAQLHQADIRQREVDFYTNNYWIWGSTAVIMAGFAFGQLTEAIPEGTDETLALFYLGFTSLCLSLDLCIITWTVLLCIWGPGMALRGQGGMKAYNDAVLFLKAEQRTVYLAFVVSVIAYFGSSCCLLWVYPSRTSVNIFSTCILLGCLVGMAFLQMKLELQIGGLGNNHEDVDGRIRAFVPFEDVADLDTFVASALPESAQATTFQRGMYASA